MHPLAQRIQPHPGAEESKSRSAVGWEQYLEGWAVAVLPKRPSPFLNPVAKGCGCCQRCKEVPGHRHAQDEFVLAAIN